MPKSTNSATFTSNEDLQQTIKKIKEPQVSTGMDQTLRSINTTPFTQKPSFILPTAIRVLARRAVLLFFNSKSFVMVVLVCRYYVGSIILSCWFVSPGVFVWASALGYVVTSSCAMPIGEAS